MKQGSLKPDGYLPRVYDRLLSEALDTFGAVEVAGPMWCGKTWTSLAFGESVTRVGRDQVRRTVEADPQIALVGERPHVIDEWQDVPQTWDAVRDAIDAGGERGSFVLTGSSTPAKDRVHHSGAGRISILRMRTMTLQETGESTGRVSLADLFEGRFEPCLVQQGLAPIADMICRGGWPALVGAGTDEASRYLDSYLDALFGTNIPKRGLDGEESRRVATSLARNLGNAARRETIAADAFSEEDAASGSARRKTLDHIKALEALYIVEEVPGWDAPIRSKSRLRTKSKLYFADPSLAAALLQVDSGRLLQEGQLFGVLFESLCMHDLAVYAQALPHAPKDALRYYRDSDGLEVDAVIELRDGRWAAFEIKLGENKADEAARSLNRLKRKVGLNPAARNPEPEFLAVIVGAGEFARFDKEKGVYVIPITALGA